MGLIVTLDPVLRSRCAKGNSYPPVSAVRANRDSNAKDNVDNLRWIMPFSFHAFC
jgi:hypothetical protein